MVRKRKGDTQKTLEGLIYAIVAIPLLAIALIKGLIKAIFWFSSKVDTTRQHNLLKEASIDLEQVDQMDGLTFEHYVAELLKKNGYAKVCVTNSSGDFGVDITAYKDNTKYAFQCKNYHSNLGVSPIQEVYSGAPKYNASACVVVTNSYFTPHAQELAHTLNVQLWDRPQLAKLIKSVRDENVPKRPIQATGASIAKTATYVEAQAQDQNSKTHRPHINKVLAIILVLCIGVCITKLGSKDSSNPESLLPNTQEASNNVESSIKESENTNETIPTMENLQYWELVKPEIIAMLNQHNLYVSHIDTGYPYVNIVVEPGMIANDGKPIAAGLSQLQYEELYADIQKELHAILDKYRIAKPKTMFHACNSIVGIIFNNWFFDENRTPKKVVSLEVAGYQVDLLEYYYNYGSDTYIRMDKMSANAWEQYPHYIPVLSE